MSNDYSLYRPVDEEQQEIRLIQLKPEPEGSEEQLQFYLIYASLLDPRVPRGYPLRSQVG